MKALGWMASIPLDQGLQLDRSFKVHSGNCLRVEPAHVWHEAQVVGCDQKACWDHHLF